MPQDHSTRWPLKVSANGRYLTDAAGKPYFYLCDTAWHLMCPVLDPALREQESYCTSPRQMRYYMDRRAAQGFNVIHCPILSEFADGKHKRHVTRPDEAYFDRCVSYVDYARSKGLTMHLIPAWMGAHGKGWWQVFKDLPEAEVRGFVRYVARKFAGYENVIWSVGGDFGPPDDHAVAVSRWIGTELKNNTDALVTFFPQSDHSSSEWFHDDSWVDFNLIEVKNPDSPVQLRFVVDDYHRQPPKPTHLGEGAYEYELEGQSWPKTDACQIRRSAWLTVLAGGFGYTYGRRGLWAFNEASEGPAIRYRIHKPWEELLDFDKSPGAEGVCHMAQFLRDRAWEKLIPEHARPFATSGVDRDTMNYTACGCAGDGSFALAYFPVTKTTSFDLTHLSGSSVTARWFDPAGGTLAPGSHTIPRTETPFTPPGANAAGNEDWVLLLEANR